MQDNVTAESITANRVLPNAQNIPGGEFASGYNGSCGEYMTLGMLHVYDPVHYPMTGYMLASIVTDAHNKYGAGANGTETMGSAVRQLSGRGIALTWVACRLDAQGNAIPLTIDWKNAITQWAGIYPIGLELANAQALRGDQVGLHFHFVLVAGLTPNGNVLLVDGDTKTGTMLYEHTIAELAAAVPVAYVRGTVAPKVPAPPAPPAPTPTPTPPTLTPTQAADLAMAEAMRRWLLNVAGRQPI